MKDGRGSGGVQGLAAGELSRPRRKKKKTKAEAVGRQDRDLDQDSDSFPLQQCRHSVPGGRLHYSRRYPLHTHRGQEQPGHRRRRDQNEEHDGGDPLGAYFQGDRSPSFASFALYDPSHRFMPWPLVLGAATFDR